MRAGLYAVIDVEAFRADAYDQSIRVSLPSSESRPQGWRERPGGKEWYLVVSRSAVKRLFFVRTSGILDGLSIKVVDVDEPRGLALVHATYPGSTSVHDQLAHPLHPDLHLDNDGATASNWFGWIAFDRLANVQEMVEELDPLRDETPPLTW